MWSWNQNFRNVKSRVVLRGDMVKDDSGSYALFTVQGSSASQMTAEMVMDIISRLPGCAGQAADAMSAQTQVKMEDAPKLLRIPHSECPNVWIRLPRHKWPNSWSNIEQHREYHIACKGFTSMSQYNFVHKFIPVPQAMKISGCEGSRGEGVGEARKVAGVAIDQSEEQQGGYS